MALDMAKMRPTALKFYLAQLEEQRLMYERKGDWRAVDVLDETLAHGYRLASRWVLLAAHIQGHHS